MTRGTYAVPAGGDISKPKRKKRAKATPKAVAPTKPTPFQKRTT